MLTDEQVDALIDGARKKWDAGPTLIERAIFRAGLALGEKRAYEDAANIALREQMWAGAYKDENPGAFEIADQARLRIWDSIRAAAKETP